MTPHIEDRAITWPWLFSTMLGKKASRA